MIRHPNITQLLDILETENSYYLVMELCPGGNLMHRIYEKKRLEEAEARRYIRQLISAVEHLHRAGVVHRDLKIENLLLDEDNNIKLIDFGLSNCAGILGHSDPFSTQCGSPAYAAPELLARKKYGPKIDVWSIGVNMYAMLTGTLPFTVEPFSLRALYQKMVDKEMNPLPTQLSTGAVSFLRSLLEPDPVKRPNIQQALANRWLHESHTGRVPCVTYPNRISLADLSPSVVLHMTQKLGYKNSDVINTVLANRACHILAVYFLLNKKLERYVSGKCDVQDGVCSKAPLCPVDRCRPGREPCEASLDTWTRDLEFHAGQDKTPKEQEKKGDFLPRPFPQKLEKHLPAHRQPAASLMTQLQSTRALLQSFGCRSIFRKTSDPSCVASSSMEFIPGPPPRTPRIIKKPEPPPQGPGGSSIAPREEPLVLDMVRSFDAHLHQPREHLRRVHTCISPGSTCVECTPAPAPGTPGSECTPASAPGAPASSAHLHQPREHLRRVHTCISPGSTCVECTPASAPGAPASSAHLHQPREHLRRVHTCISPGSTCVECTPAPAPGTPGSECTPASAPGAPASSAHLHQPREHLRRVHTCISPGSTCVECTPASAPGAPASSAHLHQPREHLRRVHTCISPGSTCVECTPAPAPGTPGSECTPASAPGAPASSAHLHQPREHLRRVHTCISPGSTCVECTPASAPGAPASSAHLHQPREHLRRVHTCISPGSTCVECTPAPAPGTPGSECTPASAPGAPASSAHLHQPREHLRRVHTCISPGSTCVECTPASAPGAPASSAHLHRPREHLDQSAHLRRPREHLRRVHTCTGPGNTWIRVHTCVGPGSTCIGPRCSGDGCFQAPHCALLASGSLSLHHGRRTGTEAVSSSPSSSHGFLSWITSQASREDGQEPQPRDGPSAGRGSWAQTEPDSGDPRKGLILQRGSASFFLG
ncbi:Hormonally up-regulated neu tumor-associated kinase [Myotis brandtii]|uniref:non-specific serine/threonine protein kinase n=1 Tax=Myotis brandtii TaxID=109478 RepID=S7P921_MYOBR|nr:Hormonally up-regulated neu tumor-associated kinase [Myotis brandtii]